MMEKWFGHEQVAQVAVVFTFLIAVAAFIESRVDKRGFRWLRLLAILVLMRALLWFQTHV